MTTRLGQRGLAALVAVVALALTACSGGDDDAAESVTASSVPSASAITTDPAAAAPGPATTAPALTVPVTAAPSTSAPLAVTATSPPTTLPAGRTTEEMVRALADDSLGGRENQSPGGQAARDLIIDELATFAEPLPGLGGYTQEFGLGTNVLAVVPGTDLADEYVMIGAHYDHLGEFGCNGRSGDDLICNGAADNATGVAAALEIGRAIASEPARRSVVIALWDAEEDGLLGSSHYVSDPVVPLDATVAYVNFDLIGSNLLPSLSNRTLAIGAESGGEELAEVTRAAADASSLDVTSLSLVFGQGRSDHAPFAGAGVPIVFFGDATNGCYHTVGDEVDKVDFGKLGKQVEIGAEIVSELAATSTPPVFDTAAPFTTFDDVVAIRDLMVDAEPDFELLGDDVADARNLLAELEQIVADGVSRFDGDDVAIVLAGTAGLIESLASTPCL